MQVVRILIVSLTVALFCSTNVLATEEKFDTDTMMSELEKQLQLNSEKMSELKSALDSKSKEMKKSLQDTIDKGFVEMDELSEKLGAVSEDAEHKLQEFLSGEEMTKLKEYLRKIDKEAVEEARDKVVQDMTEFLQLTEEQIKKLKPVLDESIMQLSQMLSAAAKEGKKGWEEFKKQYEQFAQELREKLEDTLDKDQMQRFERYNQEQKEKIKTTLFTV